MAHLAVTLALTEWKLRFFGSVLGYVWSLLRPLMLFGILYLVFSQLVAIGNGIPHYPLLLLAGLVLFATFSEITSASVTAVLDRETLVRKVAFPRLAVPLSVTVLASFGLLLNLVTVAVFVALSGVEPRWSWLLLPLPLLAMLAFATGIGMLLAALYVPFRDVRPIWDVIAQALFYATPIFWPVQALADQPEWLARLVMSNPVAVLIQEFRRLLVGPAVPSPADLVGWPWLAVPALIVVALLGVGFAVFSRMAPHMAEDL
jgi:ABC-2 type transport system permease protein